MDTQRRPNRRRHVRSRGESLNNDKRRYKKPARTGPNGAKETEILPANIVQEDNPSLASVARRTTPAAALAALGIVYGDLGTSPLYTLQAIIGATGGHFSRAAALGSLSLIFWALIITISIKYCLFVMRADNHGEGGILALMSLTGANWTDGRRVLIVIGLFGAALIYGDGIVTPAISVLSALEGLNVATDIFKPHVISMAVAILFVLFAVQSRGTAQIAKASGPVMLLWFAIIAALGVAGISRHPAVIAAVDPRYGIALLAVTRMGWDSCARWRLFGDDRRRSACMPTWATSGESDPHLLVRDRAAGAVAQLCRTDRAFSRRSGDGRAIRSFGWRRAWSIYPLVGLATVATIIASQAIITGSFSLTRQAMQLGWFPGVRIRQTSY